MRQLRACECVYAGVARASEKRQGLTGARRAGCWRDRQGEGLPETACEQAHAGKLASRAIAARSARQKKEAAAGLLLRRHSLLRT